MLGRLQHSTTEILAPRAESVADIRDDHYIYNVHPKCVSRETADQSQTMAAKTIAASDHYHG